MALTFVVAYDIADDPRRARVAAVLQSWGDRIQKSVFLLTVDPSTMSAVIDRLRGILDVDRDSLYVFRQCAGCWGEVAVHGQATVAEPVPYWAVL